MSFKEEGWPPTPAPTRRGMLQRILEVLSGNSGGVSSSVIRYGAPDAYFNEVVRPVNPRMTFEEFSERVRGTPSVPWWPGEQNF